MKKIKIGLKNIWALVDDSDFEYLSQFSWQDNGIGYAKRHLPKVNGKIKDILMHREIVGAPENLIVDHIDHNTLNNQKSNLRLCNETQNHINSINHKDNKSGYRGVSWCQRDRVWRAYIKVNKKSKALGTFRDPLLAAEVYKKAAKEYYGEFIMTGK